MELLKRPKLPPTSMLQPINDGAKQLSINPYASPSRPGTSGSEGRPLTAASKRILKSIASSRPQTGLTAQRPNTSATRISAVWNKSRDVLDKIIRSLPLDLQDEVSQMIYIMKTRAESLQHALEIKTLEVRALQSELLKANTDANHFSEDCDVYRARIKSLEADHDHLHENLLLKQKQTIKCQRAMSRLYSTNRLLIDSLEALQVSGGNQGGSSSPISHNHSAAFSRMTSFGELTLDDGKHKQNLSATYKLDNPKGSSSTLENDSKLREALLRIAREHYKSVRKGEILEKEVEDMRGRVRAAEQATRMLQLELDEVRSKDDGAGVAKTMEQRLAGKTPKVRSLTKFDERLKNLVVQRQAIDPLEAVLRFRRIVAYMASCPGTLQLSDVARHVASRELMGIMETTMICVFVAAPNRERALYKFTARSERPELIENYDSSSLVGEVMKRGQVARVNSMKHISFDYKIDGCPGLVVKNVLSLPLRDPSTEKVIGAIHLLNKVNDDVFGDIDELYAMVYADQSASAISGCLTFQHTSLRAESLEVLLEASIQLFTILPEETSSFSKQVLKVNRVLLRLEDVAKQSLKLLKCRAFLVSGHVLDMEAGELLFLGDRLGDRNHPSTPFERTSLPSSLAGHVALTKRWKVLLDGDTSTRMNPLVDLDPIGLNQVTMPVLDLRGRVIAVLQMVLGPSSPPIHHINPHVDGITFDKVAHWLSYQLATPLQYLVDCIGRKDLSTIELIRDSMLVTEEELQARKDAVIIPLRMSFVVNNNNNDDTALSGSSRRDSASIQRLASLKRLSNEVGKCMVDAKGKSARRSSTTGAPATTAEKLSSRGGRRGSSSLAQVVANAMQQKTQQEGVTTNIPFANSMSVDSPKAANGTLPLSSQGDTVEEFHQAIVQRQFTASSPEATTTATDTVTAESTNNLLSLTSPIAKTSTADDPRATLPTIVDVASRRNSSGAASPQREKEKDAISRSSSDRPLLLLLSPQQQQQQAVLAEERALTPKRPLINEFDDNVGSRRSSKGSPAQPLVSGVSPSPRPSRGPGVAVVGEGISSLKPRRKLSVVTSPIRKSFDLSQTTVTPSSLLFHRHSSRGASAFEDTSSSSAKVSPSGRTKRRTSSAVPVPELMPVMAPVDSAELDAVKVELEAVSAERDQLKKNMAKLHKMFGSEAPSKPQGKSLFGRGANKDNETLKAQVFEVMDELSHLQRELTKVTGERIIADKTKTQLAHSVHDYQSQISYLRTELVLIRATAAETTEKLAEEQAYNDDTHRILMQELDAFKRLVMQREEEIEHLQKKLVSGINYEAGATKATASAASTSGAAAAGFPNETSSAEVVIEELRHKVGTLTLELNRAAELNKRMRGDLYKSLDLTSAVTKSADISIALQAATQGVAAVIQQDANMRSRRESQNSEMIATATDSSVISQSRRGSRRPSRNELSLDKDAAGGGGGARGSRVGRLSSTASPTGSISPVGTGALHKRSGSRLNSRRSSAEITKSPSRKPSATTDSIRLQATQQSPDQQLHQQGNDKQELAVPVEVQSHSLLDEAASPTSTSPSSFNFRKKSARTHDAQPSASPGSSTNKWGLGGLTKLFHRDQGQGKGHESSSTRKSSEEQQNQSIRTRSGSIDTDSNKNKERDKEQQSKKLLSSSSSVAVVGAVAGATVVSVGDTSSLNGGEGGGGLDDREQRPDVPGVWRAVEELHPKGDENDELGLTAAEHKDTENDEEDKKKKEEEEVVQESKKYLSAPWVELYDDFGNNYYSNSDTQETFWPPESLAAHEAAVAAAAAIAARKAGHVLSSSVAEEEKDDGANIWTDPDTPSSSALKGTDNQKVLDGSQGKELDSNWSFKQGSVLRGNWLQHFDVEHREYWVHQISGQSVWDLPADWENEPVAVDHSVAHHSHNDNQHTTYGQHQVGGQAITDAEIQFQQGELRCGQWLQHFDGSGKEYWVNQITGVSAWDLPDGWESDAVIADAPVVQPPAYLLDALTASKAAGGSSYTIEL